MPPMSTFSVRGGTTHAIPTRMLEALQDAVAGLGAETYPLFLRMGGAPDFRLQPVQARALLGEVERFAHALRLFLVPGITFLDAGGAELGRMFRLREGQVLTERDRLWLTAVPEGIRVKVSGFPPPAGFRSAVGLEPLHYLCEFDRLDYDGQDWIGHRTEEFGGAPVTLPAIPVPPVTRWDLAKTAGKPPVATIAYKETPAQDVYRDLIHAVAASCEESLRFKVPFEFHRD